jgi:hypothetical protein
MRKHQLIQNFSMAVITTACAACIPFAGAGTSDDDLSGDTVRLADLVAVNLPPGNLQASVVQIASSNDLLSAVTSSNDVYIHAQSDGAWYYKSGNYLLGIEAFTQYHQEFDKWVDLGSGDKVAPAQARVVGHSFRGQGWNIPSLAHAGQWPAKANSVWVIGTENGRFGMGGAPQGIPFGTEVFGAMQTYGGIPSTPYLVFDSSPNSDSTRIRAAFAFNSSTVIGGHSAGSSAARRVGLDLGLSHVWLYGTPNYSRGSGAYSKTETSSNRKLVAEVINNSDDPVTNVLSNPFSLVSLAWGTAKCHDYSHWDFQATSPVTAVCN